MKAAENVFIKTTGEKYPTYKEILETEKFTIANTYENNQLVKESDITKYIGKIINHTIVWGEWDLTKTITQNPNSINVRLRQNFLKAPDTNLTIKVKFKIFYYLSSTETYLSTVDREVTVNFTQTTGNDKNFAYTKDFNLSFGNSSSIFKNIEITEVTITPSGTSAYDYNIIIKNVAQNYFMDDLSISNTGFYIDTYVDDTNNKIITNTCRIIPTFTSPTGNSINSINIYIDDDFNYTFGSSNGEGLSYNYIYNTVSYNFKVIDYYGERGYKLPYFYTKFVIENTSTRHKTYSYALWEPTSTQTGIELTNLIAEE